jgi:hypothetical protein
MTVGRRLPAAAYVLALGLGLATPARAGIYGVPTNLNANGTVSGTTVDPPGFLVLTGTAAATNLGDVIHQIRFSIEVTGTLLDIKVFDPGVGFNPGGGEVAGARDELLGGAATATRYTLYNPSGAVVCQLNFGPNDNATTENRLARFSLAGGACTFAAANAGNIFGSLASGVVISPGLYVFEIRRGGDVADNVFGVDIRDGAGAHYNVFTTANSDTTNGTVGAAETSMLMGAITANGNPPGNITQPALMYPWVNRGCSIITSNYDADTNGVANLSDVLGATFGLTLSGNAASVQNTITVEDPTVTNLQSINYGIYRLTDTVPNQNNLIDWRVADFTGWSATPAGFPPNAAAPIRVYLPNGYTIAGGVVTPTLPAEPLLAASARVVSGANPPNVGPPAQTTRFLLSATVDNCTLRNAADATICDLPAAASTVVDITIPLVAAATFIGGTQQGFVNGVAAACTDLSAAGFRRCRFANLAAGSAATLNIEVNYVPPAAGLQNLTGPPVAGAPPPNTTVWAQYTPASSSLLFPRTENLGPVCNLTVSNTGGALPTRATLLGLRADPTSGVVEFATGSQRDTVGFRIYGTDDPTGRGGLVSLTQLPLRAPSPSSVMPVVYRAEAGRIPTRYVLIEEIDTRGRRRVMGPFAVGDAHLRAELEAVEARLDSAGAPLGVARSALGSQLRKLVRGQRAQVRSVTVNTAATVRALKIEVGRAGAVQVPVADLEAQGLPPGTPKGHLHLANLGRSLPFQLSAGVLSFEAEALSTEYSGRNVYVLSWGMSVPAPSVRLTVSEDPKLPGDSRVERNAIYVPNEPEDQDAWMWDLIYGDGSVWPYASDSTAGDFDLPELAPGATGSVPVKIRLVGRTQHLHTVSATINGVFVGRLTFEGMVPAVLRGELPAELLQATGNHLSLSYVASPSGPDLGLVYLNGVDLGVPRQVVSASVTADRIAPYDRTLPSFAGVDYLVVTHGLFREQAERVATLKTAEGHHTAVVDVERAYDRFSGGVLEAQAVRELIRRARMAGPLRFVLLVGGDTFDSHDYLGTGAVPFVPSLLAWDGEFGRVPSENRYADVDGDGKPDVAIGRLPVHDVDEASAMADKIAAAGAVLGSAGSRHFFAVDNQGAGDAAFLEEAQWVARRLPRSAVTQWGEVAQGVAAARTALLGALQQGVLAVHYFGHGGPEVWADEGLLTVDDVGALAGNLGQTGVIFAWACEAQWYQNLLGPSVNEALVLAPGGGALASFGPAGATDPARQRSLYSRVYGPWLNKGVPLGEAIRRAKAAAAEDPANRAVVEGWNLLGDPDLRGPSLR